MSLRTWFRIALGYLAVVFAQIGVWALFAPQSFYDDFPGLGRTWVSVDGPSTSTSCAISAASISPSPL